MNGQCWKVRHATRQAARIALTAVQKRRGRHGERDLYWCWRCTGWHLTSQPRRAA